MRLKAEASIRQGQALMDTGWAMYLLGKCYLRQRDDLLAEQVPAMKSMAAVLGPVAGRTEPTGEAPAGPAKRQRRRKVA